MSTRLTPRSGRAPYRQGWFPPSLWPRVKAAPGWWQWNSGLSKHTAAALGLTPHNDPGRLCDGCLKAVPPRSLFVVGRTADALPVGLCARCTRTAFAKASAPNPTPKDSRHDHR